ncbi:UNVERIFIED_CONTAM: transporter substrate-binding domain-containing protein, partial [Bacteroidetes bacterium 56_B9]
AGREQRDRVDAALAELRASGELREISEKWFNTDITQP